MKSMLHYSQKSWLTTKSKSLRDWLITASCWVQLEDLVHITGNVVSCQVKEKPSGVLDPTLTALHTLLILILILFLFIHLHILFLFSFSNCFSSLLASTFSVNKLISDTNTRYLFMFNISCIVMYINRFCVRSASSVGKCTADTPSLTISI